MSWSVLRPRGLLLVALRQAAFGGAGVTRAECLRDDPERAAFADLLGRVGDQRREVGEDAEADHLERLEPDLEQDRRDDPGQIRRQGVARAPRPLARDRIEEPRLLVPHAELERDRAERGGPGLASPVHRVAEARDPALVLRVRLDGPVRDLGAREAVARARRVRRREHLGALARRARHRAEGDHARRDRRRRRFGRRGGGEARGGDRRADEGLVEPRAQDGVERPRPGACRQLATDDEVRGLGEGERADQRLGAVAADEDRARLRPADLGRPVALPGLGPRPLHARPPAPWIIRSWPAQYGALTSRREIFPTGVFGREARISSDFGALNGASRSFANARSSASSTVCPLLSATTAFTASPHFSSGTPTTAASSRAGCW